jgi:hypothetical protein
MIDFTSISDELRHTLASVALPEVALVEQLVETPEPLADIDAAVRSALGGVRLPRGRVAVGVGSRGIARIDEIVRALIGALKAAGATPFIVPAMGSHGASNAAGQERVLAHLGITEASVGAPIVATMETVRVGTTAAGVDVFVDVEAYAADAIVVVNRVKLHTSFRGPLESGPAKMLAIGLGKQDGARSVHAPGWLTMHENVPAAARVVLQTCKVAFGLAILENADDLPYRLTALPASSLIEEEERLLEEVRGVFPRLPFTDLDVLVVDRVGKNISGGGGDPNVTGRFPSRHISGSLNVARLVYLSLTPEAEGNGNGVGLADVVSADLATAYSPSATYLNALTTTAAENSRLPMVMPTPELAVAAALKMVAGVAAEDARLARILDTLHVKRFEASRAALRDLERRGAPAFRILSPFAPLAFGKLEKALENASFHA